MPPNHPPLLEEIHRLTLENNRLLHKMRRQVFLGRLVTIIFYLALLIGPIWFYQTYLSGSVQNVLGAYQKMQSTGGQASSQLQQFMLAFQQFEQKFQSFTSTSTSSTTH